MTNHYKIKKETAEKILEQVILRMNYNLSLTSEENINLVKEQTGQGITSVDYNSDQAKQGEQVAGEMKKQQDLKKSFNQKFITLNIPQNSQKIKQIVLPVGTKYYLFKPNDNRVDIFFSSWEQDPEKSQSIPQEKDLKYYLPDNTLRSFRLPDGKYFSIRLRKISNDPPQWSFSWYYTKEGEIYDQSKFVNISEVPEDYLDKGDEFWDTWGSWIMAGLSVAALVIIPPPAGLWISVGIDMIQSVQDLAEGNYVGATIAAILALLPVAFIKIPGIGTISQKEATALAEKFANATDEAAVKTIYDGLSDVEKKYFRTVFSQDPHKIFTELDKVMWENISKGLQSGAYDAKQLVNTINKMISEGKLKYPDLVKWYQKADVKRFGVDLGATGLILGGTYAYGKYQQSKTGESLASKVTTEKKDSYPCEEKNKALAELGLPPEPCK
jgi:hypothetical protein